MRISDWSSDVCSSDLNDRQPKNEKRRREHADEERDDESNGDDEIDEDEYDPDEEYEDDSDAPRRRSTSKGRDQAKFKPQQAKRSREHRNGHLGEEDGSQSDNESRSHPWPDQASRSKRERRREGAQQNRTSGRATWRERGGQRG